MPRLEDLCRFEASLGYIASSRPAKGLEQDLSKTKPIYLSAQAFELQKRKHAQRGQVSHPESHSRSWGLNWCCSSILRKQCLGQKASLIFSKAQGLRAGVCMGKAGGEMGT